MAFASLPSCAATAMPIRSPHATMAQWARRHLGDAPARYLITPMVRGIYGARAEDIAVDLAFPRMAVPAGHSLLSFALHRIRTRAPKPPRGRMMAPRHGMGSLTAALEKSLRSRVKFVAGAADLGSSGAGGTGPSAFGNLLICTSAPDAAKLVPDAGLARALATEALNIHRAQPPGTELGPTKKWILERKNLLQKRRGNNSDIAK
jgi:protoporphyrinogen oxidase